LVAVGFGAPGVFVGLVVGATVGGVTFAPMVGSGVIVGAAEVAVGGGGVAVTMTVIWNGV